MSWEGNERGIDRAQSLITNHNDIQPQHWKQDISLLRPLNKSAPRAPGVCGVDGITNVFLYQVDNSINFRNLKVHNGHTKKGTLFLDKGHSPLLSSFGMALHIFTIRFYTNQ